MKPLFMLSLAVFFATSVHAKSSDWKRVQIGFIENLFVPDGFDSNDNTEVIVGGYYPNKCYKSAEGEAEKDEKGNLIIVNNTIKIKMTALEKIDSQDCAEITLPFLEPVSLDVLDVLDKGEAYTIVVNENSKEQKVAPLTIVEPKTNLTDDYIYPNVISAKKIGKRKVRVTAENSAGHCYKYDGYKKPVFNGVDTFSIQIKLKQIADNCDPDVYKTDYYEFEVPELPSGVEAPFVLLHFRKRNGKSHNSVFIY